MLNTLKSKLLLGVAMVATLTHVAVAQHGMTKIAFTGDSITASGMNRHGTQDHARPNSVNQGKYDTSWSTQATYMAGGNYLYFRNWAQSGAQSTAITDNIINVALTQAELPDVLVVKMGTNDVARYDPDSPSRVLANYQRMLDAARPLGVEIVPVTIIPNSDPNNSVILQRLQLNVGIREFARRNGLKLIDMYSAVVDEYGYFKQDLTGDGVHPNSRGHRVMAEYAAKCLKLYAGKDQPWLTQSGGAGDLLNLFPNGAFLPFTSIPDTYTGYPFQSLPDEEIPGVWARYTSSSHQGAKYLIRTATVPAQPGHVYQTGFRFRTEGFEHEGWGLYATVIFYDANLVKLEENWMLHANRPGDNIDTMGYVHRIRNVAPPGTAYMNLKIITNRQEQPYTLDLAQMTNYDMTALGLAPQY